MVSTTKQRRLVRTRFSSENSVRKFRDRSDRTFSQRLSFGKNKQVGSRSRLAAATIELALVAPFILFIIFGSVEFARMMMVKQSLTNAAREGCRNATLATIQDHESSEEVVRDLLTGTIAGNMDSDIVRVTISPEFHTSPESGTEILTVVEVDCADISWLPATLFAGAKVRGVAFMNRE